MLDYRYLSFTKWLASNLRANAGRASRVYILRTIMIHRLKDRPNPLNHPGRRHTFLFFFSHNLSITSGNAAYSIALPIIVPLVKLVVPSSFISRIWLLCSSLASHRGEAGDCSRPYRYREPLGSQGLSLAAHR
jgi:hypothetical protein